MIRKIAIILISTVLSLIVISCGNEVRDQSPGPSGVSPVITYKRANIRQSGFTYEGGYIKRSEARILDRYNGLDTDIIRTLSDLYPEMVELPKIRGGHIVVTIDIFAYLYDEKQIVLYTQSVPMIWSRSKSGLAIGSVYDSAWDLFRIKCRPTSIDGRYVMTVERAQDGDNTYDAGMEMLFPSDIFSTHDIDQSSADLRKLNHELAVDWAKRMSRVKK